MQNKIPLLTPVKIFAGDTLKGHKGDVWNIAFSPDGSKPASASRDFTIRLWDVETGSTIRILNGHENYVWSVAFSLDGKKLVSGSEDETIRLWDVETGAELYTAHLDPIGKNSNDVWKVAFSPDGKLLASASDDKKIRLWNVDGDTITWEKTLAGHDSTVWSLSFNPDTADSAKNGWFQDPVIRAFAYGIMKRVHKLRRLPGIGIKSIVLLSALTILLWLRDLMTVAFCSGIATPANLISA